MALFPVNVTLNLAFLVLKLIFVFVCLGLALTYVLENSFKPESGARDNVPKIGILITDGKSQDDVISPAQTLRSAGVELFAIGIKGFLVHLCVEHFIRFNACSINTHRADNQMCGLKNLPKDCKLSTCTHPDFHPELD